jgi:hypothetical protein
MHLRHAFDTLVAWRGVAFLFCLRWVGVPSKPRLLHQSMASLRFLRAFLNPNVMIDDNQRFV